MTELFAFFYPIPGENCRDIIFFPDSEVAIIAGWSFNSDIQFFNIRRRRYFHKIPKQSFRDAPLAISPKGQNLGVVLNHGGLQIWDCSIIKEKSTSYRNKLKQITKVIFASEDIVLSSSCDCQIQVRDTRKQKVSQTLQLSNPIYQFSIQQDSHLIAAQQKYMIEIWDDRNLSQAVNVLDNQQIGQYIQYCEFHPKYKNMLVTSSSGNGSTIIQWDMNQMDIKKGYQCSLNNYYQNLLLFPNSPQILYSHASKIMMVDEVDTKLLSGEYITCMGLSPSGKQLAVVYGDQICMVDVTMWQRIIEEF